MSVLLWIILAIVAVAIIIALIGMSMPRVVHVSRSLSMAATPTKIYNQIIDLEKFTHWSPWADRDPDMTQELNGVVGVGGKMSWAGNKQVGQGTMEIIEVEKPSSVTLSLDFGNMGTATAYWTIEKEGKASKATWAIDADMGAGPIGRLMGPMMDKWVGADYEKGLENLKSVVEA